MKRMLLVEDSELFYNLLKRAMKDVDIGWARSGKEAVDMYVRIRPKLVVMDLILPDVNGIDVIKNIKSRDRDAKIIVISGIDHDEVKEEALRAGASLYIPKSSGLDYLKKKIYEEIDD